jgi:hypothetical protein
MANVDEVLAKSPFRSGFIENLGAKERRNWCWADLVLGNLQNLQFKGGG